MFKFFGKRAAGDAYLPKPKDIIQTLGQMLVVNHGRDPDWVWKLKSVVRAENRDDSRRDFRIFDAAMAGSRKVKVENYLSLDSHQELILYHGWIDTSTNQVELKAGGDGGE